MTAEMRGGIKGSGFAFQQSPAGPCILWERERQKELPHNGNAIKYFVLGNIAKLQSQKSVKS